MACRCFSFPVLKAAGMRLFWAGKKFFQIFGGRLGTGMILIIDIAFPADKLDK